MNVKAKNNIKWTENHLTQSTKDVKNCAHHKVFQNKCEETEFRMKHDYFRIYCVMPRSFEKCK